MASEQKEEPPCTLIAIDLEKSGEGILETVPSIGVAIGTSGPSDRDDRFVECKQWNLDIPYPGKGGAQDYINLISQQVANYNTLKNPTNADAIKCLQEIHRWVTTEMKGFDIRCWFEFWQRLMPADVLKDFQENCIPPRKAFEQAAAFVYEQVMNARRRGESVKFVGDCLETDIAYFDREYAKYVDPHFQGLKYIAGKRISATNVDDQFKMIPKAERDVFEAEIKAKASNTHKPSEDATKMIYTALAVRKYKRKQDAEEAEAAKRRKLKEKEEEAEIDVFEAEIKAALFK